MEDSQCTPKFKPSFRSLKSRKSGSMWSPHAAYRSPLIDDSSVPSTDTSEHSTPKRQRLSLDQSEESSLPKSNSKHCSSSSRKLLHSSYRSPFASLPIEQVPFRTTNENVQNASSKSELSVEQIKSEAKELLSMHISILNEIKELKGKGCETNQLQWYIDKLHEYNDIKDVAQNGFGRIAVLEETSVKNVHVQFGITDDD